MKKIFFLFIMLVSVSLAQLPRPIGFVNDYANILPNRDEFELELFEYEKNTTVEIVVVTLENVPEGYTLFDYGVELFEEWGIGKKSEDNGLLILIVKNGSVRNRMRIEIGYGLQGYITGAEAGRILDLALPYYAQGDYDAALDIIIMGLKDQLRNYAPSGTTVGTYTNNDYKIYYIYFIVIIAINIIIIIILLSNRCPYCVRGKLECNSEYCVCQRCGRKVTKRQRYAPILIGGRHSGGGSFGGFGGGRSGGGGAGR